MPSVLGLGEPRERALPGSVSGHALAALPLTPGPRVLREPVLSE